MSSPGSIGSSTSATPGALWYFPHRHRVFPLNSGSRRMEQPWHRGWFDRSAGRMALPHMGQWRSYLQTLMGYPAYNSGLALSPRGIGALLFTPLAGHLTTKTDPRRLLVVGVVLGSVTMFQLSGLNLYAGFWDIFWAQVLQGVALSFLFIPLMSLAMSRISPEKMGNATSIFNLMRNIGGSVGIALMTTFLARRTQVHHKHLIANVTAGSAQTERLLQGLRANFYAHG